MTPNGLHLQIAMLSIAICAAVSATTMAFPDFGVGVDGQCFVCHDSIQQDRMELLDFTGVVDPVERNGVPDQGSLKYYTTTPGGNVGMTIHAINGDSRYAFQLIGFDDPDVTNGGVLTYDDDPAWIAYRGNFPTYFCRADSGSDGYDWGTNDPVTVTYDIHVDASTPPGYYLINAALVGRQRDDSWYQGELFYLEVTQPNNDPTLTVDGTCPGGGPISISWQNATPNRTIALIYARGQGNFVIPNNYPCAGTPLGLNSQGIANVFQGPSGNNGSRTINSNAAPGACGGWLQLLDVTTCTTSNTARIQ